MLVQSTPYSAGSTGSTTTYTVLGEVQVLLSRLENLCSQMANVPDVVTFPTVAICKQGYAIHGDSYRSLRDVRLERKWTQVEVVERLRRLATEELPCDLLNTYKRWERGRNAPSHFYARLLCTVFGVDDIAFTRDLQAPRVAVAAA